MILKKILIILFISLTIQANQLNLNDFCFSLECQGKKNVILKNNNLNKNNIIKQSNKIYSYDNTQLNKNISLNKKNIIKQSNKSKVLDTIFKNNLNDKIINTNNKILKQNKKIKTKKLIGIYIPLKDGKRIFINNPKINKNGIFEYNHILKQGEIIQYLAKLYNKKISTILNYNNLTNKQATQLYPDTIIKIPFNINDISEKNKKYKIINKTISVSNNNDNYNNNDNNLNTNNIINNNDSYNDNDNDNDNDKISKQKTNDLEKRIILQSAKISVLKTKIERLKTKLNEYKAGYYGKKSFDNIKKDKKLIATTMKFMTDIEKFGKEKAIKLNYKFVKKYLYK